MKRLKRLFLIEQQGLAVGHVQRILTNTRMTGQHLHGLEQILGHGGPANQRVLDTKVVILFKVVTEAFVEFDGRRRVYQINIHHFVCWSGCCSGSRHQALFNTMHLLVFKVFQVDAVNRLARIVVALVNVTFFQAISKTIIVVLANMFIFLEYMLEIVFFLGFFRLPLDELRHHRCRGGLGRVGRLGLISLVLCTQVVRRFRMCGCLNNKLSVAVGYCIVFRQIVK